jgi:hypothetical protein
MGNHMSRPSNSVSITNHLDAHYKNMKIAKIIDNWERSVTSTMFLEDGTTPHGVGKNGKPLFEYISFRPINSGGTVIAESHNCFAIIPAGCNDGSITNGIQPYSYNIGGLSALSSLIHIVVIPKNPLKIYNAVTLRKEYLQLIKEMDSLGKSAATILINGPETMIGSLRWALSQNEFITKSDGSCHSTRITIDDISKHNNCRNLWNLLIQSSVDDMKLILEKSIISSFHMSNNASVGFLHMHTRVCALDTIALDKMEEKSIKDGIGPKNTSIEDIIPLIENGTFDEYYQTFQKSIEVDGDDDDDGTALSRTFSTIK